MQSRKQKTFTSQIHSIQTSSIHKSDIDGEVIEIIGDRNASLSWQQVGGDLQVIQGGSNYSVLYDFKGSILKLWNDFFQGKSTLDLSSDKAQLIKKRLFHLQHQIDGLLKRRIQLSLKDKDGGERFLDYTGILNEKENQIVQLEKKIQNLQERLRRASQRQAELQNQIQRLKTIMLKLQKPGVSKLDIESILKSTTDYKNLDLKYKSLKERFSGFTNLMKIHKQRLAEKGMTLEFENELNSLLKSQGMSVSYTKQVMNIVDFKDRVVQVPTGDARTKHLIHMLAVQMKKYFQKYPKLRQECDVRLAQFFQQQIIDLIQVDELQRVVQIVKYVPDVYRVENVYAYSSQKQRKIQFHLRVLIKALLEQLQKIKRKTDVVLEIDQGIIGMINAEIMDVVNVDDILKVFRVVPKIVEVQKIVEKIVDRVIEIPQVVPVQKIVQRIIQKPQIIEVQKIIHVPVEIVKYVDVHHDKIITLQKDIQKVVQVPRIIEKIIDRIVQIPKLVTEQIIRQKIIQVQKPTIVQKVIHVPVVQIQQVQVIKEKVVTVEKIIQKAVPVQVIVQKIVQRIVHVPQLVTVDKRNDILVKQIQVQNAREVVNYIQKIPQIYEIIQQRAVPLIQTVQRIVEVPKIIQKIVQVKVQVPTIQEVKVIEQKIVYMDRIKEVERISTNTVQIVREVEKVVDRIVEVPIIQQRILKIPEIVTQIVIERIQNPVIVEVEKYVEKIVQVPKIIEVETVKTIEVIVDNPVKITVEKIVEVPKTIERIKQVRVNVDKIIEKMVEVPKVVEVEKIVEKVVVVPRVIQKIIQVPQIVQKIVDRFVQNTAVVEVERVVQVPMFKDRVKIVEIPVNTYITEKDVVEKVIQKIVPVQKVISSIQVVKQTNDRIVQQRIQVPKQIYVDRVIPVAHEVSKIVQVQKQIIVPIQVPVPINKIIQKVVPIQRDVQKIVQCPQTIQKIVQVKVEVVKPQTIIQKIQVPIIRQQIIQIQKVVPYIQTQIKQVRLLEQKIILNNIEVQKIVPVDQFIQKLVTQTHEIIKAQEVQKLIDKPIQVQKVVTVENFIPVLVQVNKLIQVYRDRPIQIPLVHQQIVQVKVIQEKVVAIQKKDTQIKQVIVNHDRIIQQQKIITKTDIRNQISTQIKSIDRYEDKIIPITTSIQKIIQVPYILQKIVQKIVIMPQVVQVLKYVHEIVQEETLGVAVGVDITTQQAKYKGLYGKLKIQFQTLLAELKKIRNTNPGLKIQIQMIQSFLIQLDKLIAFPRIIQVQKQKQVTVQKKVPVLVPTVSVQSEKLQVTLAMIVSKLLGELLRIKQNNSSVKFDIDTEILKIFSDQYREKSGLIKGSDSKFTEEIHKIYGFYENFLNNLGGPNLSWQQQLIYTAALQQRLIVANLINEANLQITKAQSISDKRGQAYRMVKQSVLDIKQRFLQLQRKLSTSTDPNTISSLQQFRSALNYSFANFQSMATIQPMVSLVQRKVHEGTRYSGGISGSSVQFATSQGHIPNWQSVSMSDQKYFTLFESRFRAITKQNEILKQKYIAWQKQRPNIHSIQDRDKIIDTLQKKIINLSSELNRIKSQSSVSVNVIGNTQQYQIKIRTLNSMNQQLQSQLRVIKINYESELKKKQKQIQELQQKIKLGDLRATGYKIQNTPSSKTSFGQDRMSSSGYSGSYSDTQNNTKVNYSSGTGSYTKTGQTGATYGLPATTSVLGSPVAASTFAQRGFAQTVTSQIASETSYKQSTITNQAFGAIPSYAQGGYTRITGSGTAGSGTGSNLSSVSGNQGKTSYGPTSNLASSGSSQGGDQSKGQK